MSKGYIEIMGPCSDTSIDSVDAGDDSVANVDFNLSFDSCRDSAIITLSIDELEEILAKAREVRDAANPHPDNGGW